MLKLHFPFDVTSAGRVSGHVILNGLPFPSIPIDKALNAAEFAKVANRIVTNLEQHPPPEPPATFPPEPPPAAPVALFALPAAGALEPLALPGPDELGSEPFFPQPIASASAPTITTFVKDRIDP